MASDIEIDDSLYSRQRYVLGDSAMKRMASSNILLVNVGGLGVEIAKNIILAGVKSITIQDWKVASFHDLGTQFFLTEEDVHNKVNRAEACLKKLAALNPYVSVKNIMTPLDDSTDLSYLKDFQCVILTEIPLTQQIKVNNYCRSPDVSVHFVSGDVYGVACWVFCDFGDNFEVIDHNGEEPREVFLSNITKGNPGVVTTLENRMHLFEDGDHVTFKEIQGMTELNGREVPVKVISPYVFTVCDTSGDDFTSYEAGGIAMQIKLPRTVQFKSLEEQLSSPELVIPDLSKYEAPANLHLGYVALNKFQEQHGRLPNVRCMKDAAELLQIAKTINSNMHNQVVKIHESHLQHLSFTSQGCFAPLCATLGGIMAQEALKALTGKFTPLKQWFCLDAFEVLTGVDTAASETFQPQRDRYDALRICIGEELCRKLADLRLFMVGCGAIGCEMLKNYATLGIATSDKGQIFITDNDLIEKSNLNRQFLFRSHHIQKPKSTTAAETAKEINPDLHIDAQQYKVCPQTENVFTDSFFEAQDIVVNALDNVEARRYMDSRCVTNQRPLLESGTMGAKGHVQVILPHMTESYTAQKDPVDEDVPYCTLKSFPAVIEHCIQWARDKFESSFVQKPSMFNRFVSSNQPQESIQKLRNGMAPEGSVQASKLVHQRPSDWQACVTIARQKFEKYFNHKAKHLLYAFPLNTKLTDGSLFWQSPKRPPTPIKFDPSNATHLTFVVATARLYADVNKVAYSSLDASPEVVAQLLGNVIVPEYKKTSKKIITDEGAKKPEEETSGDELIDSANRLQGVLDAGITDTAFSQMQTLEFEKDDDSNGHIDFITAAANLRAEMYMIEAADRLKTKRIAGRIIPAIATTTAAVAGLVTVELVKVLNCSQLEDFKNCFLNLALPAVVLCEPGPVHKTKLSNGLEFSEWDRWEIQGNKDMTLQKFLQVFKEKHKVEATMVIHGVKMVYVPLMPGHKKRLPHLMTKLVKPGDKKYVDLVVSFGGEDQDEMGPHVRYYFNL